MIKLNPMDLQFALQRLPKELVTLMKADSGIAVGGGYLRSIVTGDPVNDIDVFVKSSQDARELAEKLSVAGRSGGKPTRRILETENAFTVFDYKPVIQIIHRWTFACLDDIVKSFDFSCCCAAFSFFGGQWISRVHEDFYPSNASRRLCYTAPVRDEAAGGSMLRVLKYYQKGYRIPVDSLSKVMARLFRGVSTDNNELFRLLDNGDESKLAFVLCGLLREVDPAIDPNHVAHLPSAADFAESLQ